MGCPDPNNCLIFLLRNLSSLPTIFNGSIVMLLLFGRLGSTSETVSCILATAAAHAESCLDLVENFRLAGRKLLFSRRIRQRGQRDDGEIVDGICSALGSCSTRALMLVDGIGSEVDAQ